jgi:hypothetical protein
MYFTCEIRTRTTRYPIPIHGYDTEQDRVSDPYSFFRIRSQRLRLETNPDPDPIRIQGFNDQKLKKKKKWQLKKN